MSSDNLRHPGLTDADAEAFLRTVSGLPGVRAASNGDGLDLTLEERREWYRLVISEGMDVNDALAVVRGLIK